MSETHTPPAEAAPLAPAPAEPAPVAAAVETPAPPVAEVPPALAPEIVAPETAPAVAAEAPKPHTDEPGLLSVVEKPAEAAPAEPVPAEPTPAEYHFDLPEGFVLPAEPLEQFTGWARDNNVSPEAAQAAMTMHVQAIEALNAQTLAQQHAAFADTRREWRTQIVSDPELGGSGFETNKAAAIRMMHLFVEPNRRDAFDQALLTTGMTDNPEFFRFLVNLARKFDEPAPPPPGALGPPVGAGGRAPARGGGERRAISYQFPRGRRDGAG